MAEIIQMLALSPTMEKGIIQKWHFSENDSIQSGDVLCEVETDKTVMEYESIQEGILIKILIPEGEKASVGEAIAIIGEKNEDISSLLTSIAETAVKQPSPKDSVGDEKTTTQQSSSQDGEKNEKIESGPSNILDIEHVPVRKSESTSRIKVSPLAKQLSQQYGISLNTIKGSGPEGRIVKDDIEYAHKKNSKASSSTIQKVAPHLNTEKEERLPLTEKRRVIAQRLSQSKYSAPHYYLKTTVVLDTLLETRNKYNALHSNEPLSIHSIFMKIAALAIKNNPVINTSWNDAYIIQHPTVNVALAVAQEDGLITPVVRECDTKGIRVINNEIQALIEKAQHGQLLPEEYSDSTFCISNLGSYGIEEFTAIINPPNAAILAIGKAKKTPIVGTNDAIKIQTTLKLTLSCDHRLIDGAKGALFLKDFKDYIEYPLLSLM